jgi:starvation-inducible DNA-binding protein
MVDDIAERIATLGGEPVGTPGFIARTRGWDDYSLGRALTMEHLGALDKVYEGIIGSHRACIEALETLDRVSQDMVIEQTEDLEQYHWFVRAHLEDSGGRLSTEGATGERDAARMAARGADRADSVRTGSRSNSGSRNNDTAPASGRRRTPAGAGSRS